MSSIIDLSYLERACLHVRAMNSDLVLPMCIQGWSIPAGPRYRALYAEIRDDHLITIPLDDEGKPDDMQIYPVSLFESGDLENAIREAQLRSTGRLCDHCSRTLQLPSTSDQHILINRVTPESDSGIVINIISPTPSPPPAGLSTTPFNHEFRHALPPFPDATQSNIPITDFMSPSPSSIASTSAAPIEAPHTQLHIATPKTRGHSLAPTSPGAQSSTPASHHTMLSTAPSSPYGGSTKDEPQPAFRKRTLRSPKVETAASSSNDKKKKDTNTPRQTKAKSSTVKGKGKAKAVPSTSRRTRLNLTAAQLARRQEIDTLAMAIVRLKNSPVKRNEMALHQKVADEIVSIPPNHWMNLIAIKTNRMPGQVDNWFHNRQQRIGGHNLDVIFGYQSYTLPSGEKVLKMARKALTRAQTQNFSWTDEQFESVLNDWWSRISDFYPELQEREKTIPHYSSRVIQR